jgi:DEAD/DEAH box helicase domain-containing protein
VHCGEVHVTTVATQYKKVRFYTRESVGAEDIHLPPEEIDTQAFALTLAEASAAELGLEGAERGGAWRGVGELVRRVAPLLLRCRVQDLGLSTEVRSPHFRRPTLWLWDRVQGGVGLAERLYEDHREVIRAAAEVLARCACSDGCPACIGPSPQAGLGGKQTAARILGHLSGGTAPVGVAVETGPDRRTQPVASA